MERLEPDEGKLSRPVLRGGSGGNATPLPTQLELSWEGSATLQAQTNAPGVGLTDQWRDHPGASPVTVTVDAANASVFYRLKQ